jgi:FMN phosphatase YigB (HAD superfamily)
MFSKKSALLLDMNSTFMFGEDNFDESQDFSIHYHKIGGSLSTQEINNLIRLVYEYLDKRYPVEEFRHNFPTIETALDETVQCELDDNEKSKIIDTFAFYEIGFIPIDYNAVLHKLHQKYTLAVVIDIWAPKSAWLNLFEKQGLSKLFSASSFSSDHGIVKPSEKPFEMVINKLGIDKKHALVIGDSVRRDLGGAMAADIDCVLVGGATHPDALASYNNLLELSESL